MAEIKELAPLFKGGVPTTTKELKPFADKLDAAIKIARVAMKQKGLDRKKYNEFLEQGQEWARLKLETELKMKDFIDSIKKVSGGDRKSKDFKNAPNITFDLKKTKAYIAQELLGLNPNQQREIRKLTTEGVDIAVDKAKKEGEIPTRYSALRWSKLGEDNSLVDPATSAKKKHEKLVGKQKIVYPSMSVNIKTQTIHNTTFDYFFKNNRELEDRYADLIIYLEENFHRYMYFHSPLSYIGSKEKLKNDILPYLKDKETIVSPFLGGGTLELNLANWGHNVIGYDYGPNISNFWIQLTENAHDLKIRIHNVVEEKFNIKTEDYKDVYRKYHNKLENNQIPDSLDRAALYWILIMTGFGAKLSSTTAGLNFFQKLNVSYINKKIGAYPIFGNEFKFGGRLSFEKSILKHPNDFLYCDPPYLVKNKKHYELEPEYSDDFNHEKLAEILNSRNNWVLSYNDCPEIRKLYKGHEIKKLPIKYSIGNTKDKKTKTTYELLILG